MARPEGLEPPAHCLEGSCSIHLSYGRVLQVQIIQQPETKIKRSRQIYQILTILYGCIEDLGRSVYNK